MAQTDERRLAASRRWKQKNPEHVREYRREYYEAHVTEAKANTAKHHYEKRLWIRRRENRAKLRQQVLDLYGRVCNRCGFSDDRALQVDHINGGGAKEAKRLGREYLMKRVLEHPAEYQLLCANCNWIKRSERGELNQPDYGLKSERVT